MKASLIFFVKLLTCLLITPCSGFAQISKEVAGHWEGAIAREGSVQLLKFDFLQKDGALSGKYDDPARTVFDAPLKIFSTKDSLLSIGFGYGRFDCTIHRSGEMTGVSSAWNSPLVTLHIKQTRPTEKRLYSTEEVTFHNGSVKLVGDILTPEGLKNFPIVVLIHGSDEGDRKTPYLHSQAYMLAQHGIGVLIYDKRGCGKSTGNFQTSSLYDLAGDAIAGIEYLKTRKDLADKTTIGLMGTSQGGWIAPIVVNKIAGISFLILNVGPSVSLFKQDLDRIEFGMRKDGYTVSAIDSAIAYSKLYFEVVRTGRGWGELKKEKDKVMAAPWAEFVQLPEKFMDEDMIWWKLNDFDPKSYLSKIKCPVLSIMGEEDIFVPPATNKSLMETYLALAGTKYKILILPGAGHDGQTGDQLLCDRFKWPDCYWKWREKSKSFYPEIFHWLETSVLVNKE